MNSYKVDWTQNGNKGTVELAWWIDNGYVKVKVDGDLPNLLEFNENVTSRKASKAGHELLYRELNDQGYDYK